MVRKFLKIRPMWRVRPTIEGMAFEKRRSSDCRDLFFVQLAFQYLFLNLVSRGRQGSHLFQIPQVDACADQVPPRT